ncbi:MULTISPECIES: (2Fe-2S)-binding protein [unclassified Mycobacterium]|uniref:(2Fe-2S)-binding protein n=1 Tax=unclassified Mycobacterium TaxID=2642494 RepID=UPI0007403888|nr:MULTISPECIES: (2Fe-2S)-binding protein [unclassified Mycobacterium]KUH85537.1 hypothetical protein AU186_22565 [Mycobacterium sp. GA-1999]KUH91395.1 hypothetical protein AU185_09630 [Mycobacterium sp. GA-0227b]KUH96350.1 hypothetical protein AU187_14215 [Mycobacterium sp. IS-1556]
MGYNQCHRTHGTDSRTRAQPWADRRRVETALANAAELGPYFALHRDATRIPLPPQQMYQRRRLQSLLSDVAEDIGTDEGRVAASTLQYGFAARCWSVVLGVWHHAGLLIDTRELELVITAPGSIALAMGDLRAWDCASVSVDEAAALIADAVIAHPLGSLHTALHRVVRIADGLLWGNAASALVSAPQIVTEKRPNVRLTAVTAAILSRSPLANRLAITANSEVRRRSCCLWYRTRHQDNCADCPLTGRATIRRRTNTAPDH